MINLYECPKPQCGLFQSSESQCPYCERRGAKLLQRDVETRHFLVRDANGPVVSHEIVFNRKNLIPPEIHSKVACEPDANVLRVRVTNDPGSVNCKFCQDTPEWKSAPKTVEAFNGSE